MLMEPQQQSDVSRKRQTGVRQHKQSRRTFPLLFTILASICIIVEIALITVLIIIVISQGFDQAIKVTIPGLAAIIGGVLIPPAGLFLAYWQIVHVQRPNVADKRLKEGSSSGGNNYQASVHINTNDSNKGLTSANISTYVTKAEETMSLQVPSRRTPFLLISYNEADENFAAWIQNQLEEAGYATIRRANFLSGRNTVLELDASLRAMTHALVVLSPKYLEENGEEWANVFRTDPTGKGLTLIPIYVEDCKAQLAKGFLGGIAAIDLIGKDDEAAREVLLREIRRSVDGVEPQRTVPPPFPGKNM